MEMNYRYSRNLRKAEMARRVIALVCLAAFLGLAAGYASGYAMKAHMVAKKMERSAVFTTGQ